MRDPRPEDIRRISPDDMADPVAELLVERACYLGHKSINYIADFDDFMELDEPDGYSVHFTVGDKAYRISDTKTTIERRIYAVDTSPGGEVVGYGGLSESLTSKTIFTANKPIVLGIETYDGFREQGYGRRRYLAMNAASLLIFGDPLHSQAKGNMLSDLATRRWEAFIREGLAETYLEPQDMPGGRMIQRYRFKTDQVKSNQS